MSPLALPAGGSAAAPSAAAAAATVAPVAAPAAPAAALPPPPPPPPPQLPPEETALPPRPEEVVRPQQQQQQQQQQPPQQPPPPSSQQQPPMPALPGLPQPSPGYEIIAEALWRAPGKEGFGVEVKSKAKFAAISSLGGMAAESALALGDRIVTIEIPSSDPSVVSSTSVRPGRDEARAALATTYSDDLLVTVERELPPSDGGSGSGASAASAMRGRAAELIRARSSARIAKEIRARMKVPGAKLRAERLVDGSEPPKPESPGNSARCGSMTEGSAGGAAGVAAVLGPPKPAPPGPSREELARVVREVQLHDMDL